MILINMLFFTMLLMKIISPTIPIYKYLFGPEKEVISIIFNIYMGTIKGFYSETLKGI